MTILLLVLVLLFALIAAGAPIYVALGLSSLVYFFSEGIAGVAAAHTMINGLNSFTLIAIPFFILAGHLMNAAGFTERIFTFARAVIGWAPGGLGHVNIGASVVFAGMSGAAVADAGSVVGMREATDFQLAAFPSIANQLAFFRQQFADGLAVARLHCDEESINDLKYIFLAVFRLRGKYGEAA